MKVGIVICFNVQNIYSKNSVDTLCKKNKQIADDLVKHGHGLSEMNISWTTSLTEQQQKE